MSSFAIETKELSYTFGKGRKVVDNLSLQVPQSSIFGFLGPNGAGKTTTMRLLTGLLRREEDNIYLNGQSLKKTLPFIFKDIGTLIETPSLYLHLSAINNLKIIATLRNLNVKKIEPILETVGLQKDAKRKVKEYSLGMKQRLAIAMALLPDPQMIMLDEPANGLDPSGIIQIRELLIKLNREQGKTVFVSSHLLSEVEKMCTHVAIIHKGVLQFQGDMNSLRQSAEGKTVTLKISNTEQWKNTISEKFPHLHWNKNGELIASINELSEVSQLNSTLVQAGVPIVSIQPSGGLEEWFVQMTKN